MNKPNTTPIKIKHQDKRKTNSKDTQAYEIAHMIAEYSVNRLEDTASPSKRKNEDPELKIKAFDQRLAKIESALKLKTNVVESAEIRERLSKIENDIEYLKGCVKGVFMVKNGEEKDHVDTISDLKATLGREKSSRDSTGSNSSKNEDGSGNEAKITISERLYNQQATNEQKVSNDFSNSEYNNIRRSINILENTAQKLELGNEQHRICIKNLEREFKELKNTLTVDNKQDDPSTLLQKREYVEPKHEDHNHYEFYFNKFCDINVKYEKIKGLAKMTLHSFETSNQEILKVKSLCDREWKRIFKILESTNVDNNNNYESIGKIFTLLNNYEQSFKAIWDAIEYINQTIGSHAVPLKSGLANDHEGNSRKKNKRSKGNIMGKKEHIN